MSKRKRGSPWWVHQKYAVETVDRKTGAWVEIYSASSVPKATEDARAWEKSTGMATRIVPGAGHPTKRGW